MNKSFYGFYKNGRNFLKQGGKIVCRIAEIMVDEIILIIFSTETGSYRRKSMLQVNIFFVVKKIICQVQQVSSHK